MIHVVQVLTDTNIGGAGKYLLNYLKYYDRSTFKVSVILPRGSRLLEYVRAFGDLTVYEAPYMADQSFNKHCVRYLKVLLNKIKPDILHSHACLSARIAGRAAKVPVILATRHCVEAAGGGIKSLLSSFLNNYLCDYYIAVSGAIVENLLETGIDRKKIKLVCNGVEPMPEATEEENAAVREKLGILKNETVFGIFGRLEPVKGHKYFIKAARQLTRELKNVKFLIVGGGSLEDELRERVRRYGLSDRVIFTGFTPNVSAYLNMVDVNVNASESEAMSLSILEAMSLAKPIIATDVGGNGELIQDGITGLLVGYSDSSSLAYSMQKFAESPELMLRLGKNAKASFEKSYTAQIMTASLEKIYREVLEHDRG